MVNLALVFVAIFLISIILTPIIDIYKKDGFLIGTLFATGICASMFMIFQTLRFLPAALDEIRYGIPAVFPSSIWIWFAISFISMVAVILLKLRKIRKESCENETDESTVLSDD